MALSGSDIKNIRCLQQKKFRKERGLFVVEGIKMVNELVRSDYSVACIYTTKDVVEFENQETIYISEKELSRISGLKNPNRVLAIAETQTKDEVDYNQPLILILDGIRDPGNLGTIIRTAKWFGINTIICSEDCAENYNPKTVQSTMGALFHVNVHYSDLEQVLRRCKQEKFDIVGASMDGGSLYNLKAAKKTAVIIGSESHGISDSILELCDVKATIPNRENDQKVESLNAAVANALFLSELTKTNGR